MDTDKTIIWKVHCPADGPQLLRHTALHVYIRAGLSDHVVTYFCPECGQQRYQLVGQEVCNALVEDLHVAYSVIRVPLEALEPRHGPAITEADVDRAVALMGRPGWRPPRDTC